MRTAVPELDPREAAMGVDGIGSRRQRGDIIFVPQCQEAERRIIR